VYILGQQRHLPHGESTPVDFAFHLGFYPDVAPAVLGAGVAVVVDVTAGNVIEPAVDLRGQFASGTSFISQVQVAKPGASRPAHESRVLETVVDHFLATCPSWQE